MQSLEEKSFATEWIGPRGAVIRRRPQVVVLRPEIQVMAPETCDPLILDLGDLQRVVAVVTSAGERPMRAAVHGLVQTAVRAEEEGRVGRREGAITRVAVIADEIRPRAAVVEGSRGCLRCRQSRHAPSSSFIQRDPPSKDRW